MLIQARRTFAALVSLLFLASGAAGADLRFQPGDRVECDWLQNGSYEKGVVVPFERNDLDRSGRWYRVKLDKDTIPNSTVECMANRLRQPSEAPRPRPSSTAAPKGPTSPPLPGGPNITFPGGGAEVAKREAERRSPPNSGGPAPRVLPGTAWKIDFGRGLTGALFLFCRTGTWHNVLAGGRIGAVGRSYSVSGTTLTTVNRDDGMTQRWRMTWQGDVLTLFDGKETLKLHYNGETQCK